ncbi:MAG: diguanylate cyclase [Bacillota bacterium]
MKVLIADDDRMIRNIVKKKLLTWGYSVVEAADGNEAWRILNAPDAPSIILTDWEMPGMDGMALCRKISDNIDVHYVYQIVLTGKTDRQSMLDIMRVGADDFVRKPFDNEELEVRIRAGCRIVELQQRLTSLLRHDGMTGALNHAASMSEVKKLVAYSVKNPAYNVMLMCDLDFFKRVNDENGHLFGDEVLRETVVRLKAAVGERGMVGRYGGEEFIIILPNCQVKEGVEIGERCLNVIRDQKFCCDDNCINVTISIGGAVWWEAGADTWSPDRWLKAADSALYMAKHNGRNRLEFPVWEII